MDMIDPFGRTISYLRVSVTDRCDFRCTYCMAEDMTFLPKKDLLSLEELERLCAVFIDKGVRKLRLTGGEPLVRKNIMHLVRQLSRHLDSGALEELTLTTNGSQLSRFAAELADCGVKRINVSLDTLDADKFHQITRWGHLGKVMDGIDAAQAAGLKVKLNAVVKPLDQTMLRPEGLPGRPWYMNMVYAPGRFTGYGAKTLPGVREAIEEGRWADADKYAVITAKVLDTYADQLDAATKLINGM